MLYLVKDFEDYNFIFYWIDEDSSKTSPDFPTLEHAKEWFIKYHYEQYLGPERRKCMVDRRKAFRKGEQQFRQVHPSVGRRVTDKSVEVDIDRAKEKLSRLKSTHWN